MQPGKTDSGACYWSIKVDSNAFGLAVSLADFTVSSRSCPSYTEAAWAGVSGDCSSTAIQVNGTDSKALSCAVGITRGDGRSSFNARTDFNCHDRSIGYRCDIEVQGIRRGRELTCLISNRECQRSVIVAAGILGWAESQAANICDINDLTLGHSRSVQLQRAGTG